MQNGLDSDLLIQISQFSIYSLELCPSQSSSTAKAITLAQLATPSQLRFKRLFPRDTCASYL